MPQPCSDSIISMPTQTRQKLSTLLLVGANLLLPGIASADCTLSGAGTAASPYLIGTYSDLKQLSTTFGCDLSKTYLMTADIDASPSKGENGRWGFAPIGDSAGGNFTGEFNGGGHKISNLYINDSSKAGVVTSRDVGLFGQISGTARVHHLTLVDVSVEGRSPDQNVGAIAGRLWAGSIDSCTVMGGRVALIPSKATTTSGNVGGVVGMLHREITFCLASDSVIGPNNSSVGGIVGRWGQPYARINKCHSSGYILGGNKANVGGIIGYSEGLDPIDSSSTSGTIAGGIGASVGGIAGYAYRTKIDSCSATGKVIGDSASQIGGITGYSGTITHSIGLAEIKGAANSSVGGISGYSGADYDVVRFCYARGMLSGGKKSFVGGIAGKGSAGISNSFADIQISAEKESTVGGLVGHGNSANYLNNCYAIGAVSAHDSSMLGGLVGNWTSSNPIRTSYSLVNVGGSAPSLRGQIAGYAPNAEALIWYSYWDTKNEGPTTSLGKLKVFADTVTAFGLTTAQMMDQSNFRGFSFAPDSAWIMVPNSYPLLRGMENATAPGFGTLPTGIKPSVKAASSLRWVGRVAMLELTEPAKVQMVDLQGRVILPESNFSAGTHDLALPSNHRMLFAQIRTKSATRTLPLRPLN